MNNVLTNLEIHVLLALARAAAAWASVPVFGAPVSEENAEEAITAERTAIEAKIDAAYWAADLYVCARAFPRPTRGAARYLVRRPPEGFDPNDPALLAAVEAFP